MNNVALLFVAGAVSKTGVTTDAREYDKGTTILPKSLHANAGVKMKGSFMHKPQKIVSS